MSKTETQSKAESLAKMLEFGAFSPNLLQNEIGVRKGAAEELRRLDARVKSLEFSFNEWHDKTDWVQETAQARELGMHRADVLRSRIEALDAENKALRDVLNAVAVDAIGIGGGETSISNATRTKVEAVLMETFAAQAAAKTGDAA